MEKTINICLLVAFWTKWNPARPSAYLLFSPVLNLKNQIQKMEKTIRFTKTAQ
ncbi:hypothetical protein [Photorhabdus khanii]|uniref:hypothetical protein n=1 Tax=Photorhabdus khanii TaxID=1004150 RepID=UPI001864E7FB|nr:hypothetical protein [Photorhabdus khanii]